MTGLLGNILLALIWMALTGSFTLRNLAFGFVLGFAVLDAAQDILRARGYTQRVIAAFVLAAIFARELTLANIRLAIDILTPKHRANPAVVGVDIDATGDMEILILAQLVTLTPGSVAIHVTEDRRRMFVYGMYAKDPEVFRNRIKEVFERRVLAMTRGEVS